MIATQYSSSDIVTVKGHIMTSNKKYYLQDDGTGYCYWHEMISLNGDIAKLSHPLGHTSYDYCFRVSSKEDLAERLNKVLK